MFKSVPSIWQPLYFKPRNEQTFRDFALESSLLISLLKGTASKVQRHQDKCICKRHAVCVGREFRTKWMML